MLNIACLLHGEEVSSGKQHNRKNLFSTPQIELDEKIELHVTNTNFLTL